MVYLLKCANDASVNLQLKLDEKYVEIRIEDEDFVQFMYLTKIELFELIGVLHHLQKQMK